jgi:uncharacterized protein (DUF2235 family)
MLVRRVRKLLVESQEEMMIDDGMEQRNTQSETGRGMERERTSQTRDDWFSTFCVCALNVAMHFALLWATLATHWVPSVHNSSYWPLVKLCMVSVRCYSNI